MSLVPMDGALVVWQGRSARNRVPRARFDPQPVTDTALRALMAEGGGANGDGRSPGDITAEDANACCLAVLVVVVWALGFVRKTLVCGCMACRVRCAGTRAESCGTWHIR